MTKEQYLAIRAAWSQYIKDGKHKKQKVFYTIYDWSDYRKESYGKAIGQAYDWKSDLTAIHHYIYSKLRKRDMTKAFSEEKLISIAAHLKYILDAKERHSKYLNEATKTYFNSKNYNDCVVPLLVPFGEEFTLELLESII